MTIINEGNVDKILGERVKKLREDKKMTQEELGRELSVSRTEISKLEKGERSLKAGQVLVISEYFKVSFQYLYGQTDCQKRNSEEIKKTLSIEESNFKAISESILDLAKEWKKGTFGTYHPKLQYDLARDLFNVLRPVEKII